MMYWRGIIWTASWFIIAYIYCKRIPSIFTLLISSRHEDLYIKAALWYLLFIAVIYYTQMHQRSDFSAKCISICRYNVLYRIYEGLNINEKFQWYEFDINISKHVEYNHFQCIFITFHHIIIRVLRWCLFNTGFIK